MSNIDKVWKKFKDIPMETVTKYYVYFHNNKIGYQRSLDEIINFHNEYGFSGNCFDLALWLKHEFDQLNIDCYYIGHHFFSSDAHIAIVALDNNQDMYLCDLGDQWIKPLPINRDFENKSFIGYFPNAIISYQYINDLEIVINYKRPNGKVSKQTYDLSPISNIEFMEAANHSQNLIKSSPLIEKRKYRNDEVLHWEFEKMVISIGSKNGVEKTEYQEFDRLSQEINKVTGFDIGIIKEVLINYESNI
ncbi:hypothetical protein [Macrococcus animalis]|uniref:hypothetical protein n=1 Tax=Macrococcus animalis TaxID=3395467 RepID=UPI0039BE12C3